MRHRTLGNDGPSVSVFGLGCMGMSEVYGPSDRTEGIATIHAALDAGVTLLDTGDFYGMGHNEMLLAETIKGVPRDKYQVSVKFGALRDPAGGFAGFDGRPAAVKNFLATRCGGSGSNTSTSTVPRGSTAACRSRRRSAPSPTW